ncbi:hypothetical protein Ahy_A04g019503 [Arachis hypogaea]|uniref:Uncharacterized protein n=1 Tax=Arachis hypogaea TaxID=3818 RepID=A0A445DG12_ARAHY|nr:hypothetical protein Ahy_A04g019503 [Arachis hypogaea]
MPRKLRYNIIWELPKDVGSMTRGAQISRKGPASRINEPFYAPYNDKRLAPSSSANDPQTPTECTEARHHVEVVDNQLEDEDYNPKVDEVLSFDDHIDDLSRRSEQQRETQRYRLLEKDSVRKVSKLSVKEAIALPSNTKIILSFNKELQPIGQTAGLLSNFLGSLGTDYSHLPRYKERNNVKDIRHNLYHKCYKETRTFEENLKHFPSGIEENHWKWFLEYRQKEETKKNCEQNTLNQSKQLYTYTEGSKNIGKKKRRSGNKRKNKECPLVEESCLSSLIRKKMARISIPMRMLLDESSKHLSQNYSLAQVLGKEYPGRVCTLGAGLCPTQVFGNTTGQPSDSGEPNKEYERRIAELTAKIEE